jgi:hypothetical protein
MAEYLALGTPITFAAATDIALSVVLTDGAAFSATLNSSDAAYLQIAAGTYRFPELCQLVITKIITWYGSALTGDATVSASGSPTITLTFAPSTSANGSTVTLTFTTSGAIRTSNSDPLFFSSVTLNNATSGLWTKLGLAYETEDGTIESNRTTNASGNVVTIASRFQPRSIFVFERAVEDTFNSPSYPIRKTHILGNGQTRTFKVGAAVTTRTLRLLDMGASVGGPGLEVATFSAWGSNRSLITITNPTVSALSGISALYVQTSLLTDGRYLRVANVEWVSRSRDDSTTQVRTCDKFPSSATVASGSPITMISELEALFFEVERLGKLCVWETTDAGAIRWTGAMYTPRGEPRFVAERRDAYSQLWSYEWDLVRCDDPDLDIVS